jgi:hypothetical protein
LYAYFLANCAAPSCPGKTAVITWEEPIRPASRAEPASHAEQKSAVYGTMLIEEVANEPAAGKGVKDARAH